MPVVTIKNGEVVAGGENYGEVIPMVVRKPRQRRPFSELPADKQLVENLPEARQVEVTFFQQDTDRIDGIISRRRKKEVGRGGDRTKLMIGNKRQPL